MEAAEKNDVRTMKNIGKGLNANARNVVGLAELYKTALFDMIFNATQAKRLNCLTVPQELIK